jgi:hypothetical protein
MPVTSQMTDYRSSPSSGSQFQPRLRHITRVSHGSKLPPPSYFQPKPGLIQQNLSASLGGSTAAKGDFATGTNLPPISDTSHSQAIGHDFPNTQFTTSTTRPSTFQESPWYLEQGQLLQTDFGFHLPANKPFPDWMNDDLLPPTMLVPVTSNPWDRKVVTGSFDRDATLLEHLPWRHENSFK